MMNSISSKISHKKDVACLGTLHFSVLRCNGLKSVVIRYYEPTALNFQLELTVELFHEEYELKFYY